LPGIIGPDPSAALDKCYSVDEINPTIPIGILQLLKLKIFKLILFYQFVRFGCFLKRPERQGLTGFLET